MSENWLDVQASNIGSFNFLFSVTVLLTVGNWTFLATGSLEKSEIEIIGNINYNIR